MRPSPYDQRVAAFLKERRGSRTYRDYAPVVGLSRSALHRLENLEQSITLAKLDGIARRLRTTVEEILRKRPGGE